MLTRPGALVALLLLVSGTALSGCLSEDLIKQPELTIIPGAPPGWGGTANTSGIGTTVSDRRSGTTAAYLSNAFQLGIGTVTIVQAIRADDYRGKRVRLSGWIKPRNVGNAVFSGLWMRVDGPGTTLTFDNMAGRPVSGYGDWRQVSVVLDVPQSAIGISFGALFQASNTLLVDDLRFDVVGSDVVSTNRLDAPTSSGRDSTATVVAYERSNASPVNLDFEGLAPIGSETASWIIENATTLSTADPTASLDDLEPLRAMVGSAHVVGLGEATHGTREFFLLKHRMLRFLVTRMGFTTFAIEASAPEADDLNQYVLFGIGDPVRLLSRLYFWTWNTQEVLDQITWMRQWNSTASADQRVQFRGIDMQYPSASMDSVVAFMHRADPTFDVDVLTAFQCLEAYRNRGNVPGRPRTEYAAQSADTKFNCADGLATMMNIVRTRGAVVAGYQAALHHARLVQQFEAVAAMSNSTLSNRLRDDAMAENVAWLRDQGGANAKLVVWAHNDHVTRQTFAMGAGLNARYGADYRALAFAFGTGRFNAVRQEGTTLGIPQSLNAQAVPSRSIEEVFVRTNLALVLLDMRKVLAGGAPAHALRGPIAMRSIGSAFDANLESLYFVQRIFPGDFDLLLFVRGSTASTLLPYRN